MSTDRKHLRRFFRSVRMLWEKLHVVSMKRNKFSQMAQTPVVRLVWPDALAHLLAPPAGVKMTTNPIYRRREYFDRRRVAEAWLVLSVA